MLRALCTQAATLAPGSTCKELDAPPATIDDTVQVVLGDGFHVLDRAKVPMHHSSKKAYFVALMNAFYDWDEVELKVAKDALRAGGKAEKEVEHMLFFKPSWFCACVRRRVLPPSKLYNTSRRASPDVSALGFGFQVIVSNRTRAVGGTSASAPTVVDSPCPV